MTTIIPHWLTKQAYLSPNQIALETEDDMMTFLELKKTSERFAKKLAQLGVEKGDHVGVLSTNNVSMVIAIHALSYLGSVCVMLNTHLTKAELSYQVKDAEISCVLINDGLKHEVNKMGFQVAVKTFSDVDQLTEQTITLQTEINLEDVFTIIYTSGTTGSPKGVVHTYGNHWWSAIGSSLNLGLHKNDKWLAVLPLFHVGGLSILMRSVIYGIPVYLLADFSEKRVNEAILGKRVTIISVVTVMLQRLIKDLDESRYPATLRCVLLGGGPAPKPLLEKAKKMNVPVFQSYGMTETTSQIVTLSPEDSLLKIGSAGKPLFPGQLNIIKKDAHNIGEIVVKGPMVTKEYFNNNLANEQAFKNGWLLTGDLGYLDKEGYLYVVDRRTDLIISGGENVYPAEVEGVLLGMEQIREVGVVGEKDSKWGQVPVAFIVANEENITLGDIQAFTSTSLASYKIPKALYLINELPRNAANKLVRQTLIEWLK